MRKIIFFLFCLLASSMISFGQITDSFAGSCAVSAGAKARYLKDFRIQLGKAAPQGELRYKANMTLWKNTKYRFTLCNSNNSKGQLIFNLRDGSDQVVASSIDQKTGQTYKFIDYTCNKSGIYSLNYDFTGRQQGSGVGVVSMIR
jgi:hypothetical protein